MEPIPGQANIRTADLAARSDGAPITAGTVNLYLYALTGTNAGKWWRNSDDSWQGSEVIAVEASPVGDGHWKGSIHTGAWTADVEYLQYAKESGDLHVPISEQVRCQSLMVSIADLLAQAKAALVYYNLDHLLLTPVAVGGDMTPEVADGTILSNLMTKAGDTSAFTRSSDSLEGIADLSVVAGQAGAYTNTFTVNAPLSVPAVPLAGADVWVTADSGGTDTGSPVWGSNPTNASGQVTVSLDAGTYWIHAQKPGYSFDTTYPKKFTVTSETIIWAT